MDDHRHSTSRTTELELSPGVVELVHNSGPNARDRSWMVHALCRTTAEGRALDWFPTRGDKITEQRRICEQCPVQTACLEYGLREGHGIWGGLSERARRAERKARGTRLATCRGCGVLMVVLRVQGSHTLFCTAECKRRRRNQLHAEYARANGSHGEPGLKRGA